MKKLKFLLLVLMLSLSASIQAQRPTVVGRGTYVEGGLQSWDYEILSNDEARIVGGILWQVGSVTSTPFTVRHNGRYYTVTSIGRGAFKEASLPLDFALSSTIKVVEDSAFYGCNLFSIALGNVEKIGRAAFANCPYLSTPVVFPQSIKDIREKAFEGCEELTSVKFLGSAALNTSAASMFSGCKKLTSVSLPEGTTRIPTGFLSGCMRLTSINIPSTVTSIEQDAFYRSGLTSVSLQEGLTKIEGGAFLACKALTGNIVIPNTVTSIGVRSFAECDKITSVAMTNAITSLGEGVFRDCRNLTSVTGYPTTLTDVPADFFCECINLTHIEGLSPALLTTVGNSAFRNCRKLTGLSQLSSALTTVGEFAFCRCSSMVGSLTIPNVTKVGQYAFYGCSGLTGDLALQNAQIGGQAFGSCTGLNGTLTLKNCTFFGSDQFAATRFHHLDTDAATLRLINGGLFGILDPVPINYLYGSYNPSDHPSMTFDESLITGMDVIPNNFLINMPQLVGKITFSPNLTSIGDNAFANTRLVADLKTIPASATIGKGVFRLFPNMTIDAVIPDNYPMESLTSSDNVFSELPDDGHVIGNYRTLPYIYSGITSMDLGNLPFYFYRESGMVKDRVIGSIWVDKYWGIESPNLLWVDARRCDISYEGGSNNFLKWTFVRKWDATPVDYYQRYFNFRGLKANALVYLPSETNFKAPTLADDPTFDERFATDEDDDETGGDGSNFIMDGKCKQFFVKDGLSYRVPFPFTAQAARYTRTFNVTTGKAVSTLYLPYPTDLPAGMCAYTLVKKNVHDNGEKTFVFREVPQGTRLEANKPYLVRITDGQPHKLPVMRNVAVPASPTVDAAGQLGIETSDWKFFGTTEKIDNAAAYEKKAYYLNGNKWWAVQNGVENDYIAPFRCFISSPTGAAASRSFLLVLEGDDSNVTGIQQLEGETEKDIHSGKYPFYSIDGRLMGKDYNKLERGQIYIVNGKKFYKF